MINWKYLKTNGTWMVVLGSFVDRDEAAEEDELWIIYRDVDGDARGYPRMDLLRTICVESWSDCHPKLLTEDEKTP